MGTWRVVLLASLDGDTLCLSNFFRVKPPRFFVREPACYRKATRQYHRAEAGNSPSCAGAPTFLSSVSMANDTSQLGLHFTRLVNGAPRKGRLRLHVCAKQDNN